MSVSSSARSAHPRRTTRAAATSSLPHWSEPSTPRSTLDDGGQRIRPSPPLAAILRDLVSWASDLAIILTHGDPDDREAIEQVRDFAYAWLDGEPRGEPSIDHILTTAATLMSGIDLRLSRASDTPHPDSDERTALDAAAAHD